MSARKNTFPTALVWLAASLTAQAHDPGLSSLACRFEPGGLVAQLTLARSDVEALCRLDTDHDGRVTPAEFAAAASCLEAAAVDALEVRLDGRLLAPGKPTVQLDTSEAVHLQLLYPCRAGSRLAVRSVVLHSLPRGHRQFASLHQGQSSAAAEAMLDANHDTFDAALAQLPPAASTAFSQFLRLGVTHILTGYDHLLFLFALLVVARRFSSAVRIVTCFTLAHSITLAVATFDLVRIPSRLTEALIAATIVYVGLENLLRRDEPKGRGLLTFAFGLVHGFGFASVLRELGVASGGTGVAVPLFSFNLGVELGQIAVAAAFLPCWWMLKRRPALAPRLVPACSLLVTLAGSGWLVERLWPA
ncbi:MAG: HupE/UreJ family protein [Verrucomicrobia bacterium]|nr:HupE/UreJ family protein [Verrucomicrobiota bacterium]